MAASRILVALGLILVAVTVAAVLLWPKAGPSLAANSCADVDGDGIVHTIDAVMVGEYWGDTVPPAPPQVDLVKDVFGVIDLLDIQAVVGRFEITTDCQTTPLAKATLPGGTLAVDADGETTTAGDPVDAKRSVPVGATFHVTVQLVANPGIVGYQARLHWDEARLDFNPRTAAENDLTQGGAIQVLGPPDDKVGIDAFIELGAFQVPTVVNTLVGPIAQFEFTCQAGGTANLILTDPGTHTALVSVPATEYTPAISNAQIDCVKPVGGVAELPDVAAAPSTGPDASSSLAGIAAAAIASALALGGAAWFARRRWTS